mmetsp:Transcript_189/g.713  ORF Transcript_189/g.713 Transcript_189/m.713 type:complete len:273 (-) Transcript_189:433-1251(-)
MISAAASAVAVTEAPVSCSSFHRWALASGCTARASAGKPNMPELAPPVRIIGTTMAPRAEASRASCATPGPPSTVTYTSPSCANTTLRSFKSAPAWTSKPTPYPLDWPSGRRLSTREPSVQFVANVFCTPSIPPVTNFVVGGKVLSKVCARATTRAEEWACEKVTEPRTQTNSCASRVALSDAAFARPMSCVTTANATETATLEDSLTGADVLDRRAHCSSDMKAGFAKASCGKLNIPLLAPPVRMRGITQARRATAALASIATPGPPSTVT